jgi:ATP-dependent helicase/DNAse subunit B
LRVTKKEKDGTHEKLVELVQKLVDEKIEVESFVHGFENVFHEKLTKGKYLLLKVTISDVTILPYDNYKVKCINFRIAPMISLRAWQMEA